MQRDIPAPRATKVICVGVLIGEVSESHKQYYYLSLHELQFAEQHLRTGYTAGKKKEIH